MYARWKPLLDPRIELVPLELAGRGKRIMDGHYKDLPDAIDDVFRKIRDAIGEDQYALFGHSMGAKIAYELAHVFRKNCVREPTHIFFSGWRGPHAAKREKKFHLMNDEEFVREVLQLGGTPPEFFQYPELMQLFLPMLKNDFRLAEEDLKAEGLPFNCDISIFLGKDDELTCDHQDGWKRHSLQRCKTYHFEGGHFFLHDQKEKISHLINTTLLPKYDAHYSTGVC